MQTYSDTSRANEPGALPDVEVFYVSNRDWPECPICVPSDQSIGASEDFARHTEHVGWYWQSAGGPHGPFATKQEAIDDAKAEVFYVGPGSLQTCPPCQRAVFEPRQHAGLHVGWYWERGAKSGYGRKGEDSHGPFDTEAEAIKDARSTEAICRRACQRQRSRRQPTAVCPRHEVLLCRSCARQFAVCAVRHARIRIGERTGRERVMSNLHVTDYLNIEDLPRECINDCSAPGQDASEAVMYWTAKLGFTVQRDRAEIGLRESGGWTREEIAEMDDSDVAEKVLWLACNDFREYLTNVERGYEPDNVPSGSSVYALAMEAIGSGVKWTDEHAAVRVDRTTTLCRHCGGIVGATTLLVVPRFDLTEPTG